VESHLSGPRWRVVEPEAIDWREWGDEFVVHVATRAETHLLSAAAGSILRTLIDGRRALTLDDIFATAMDDPANSAGSQTLGMTAAERESLQAVVVDFERLGILVRSAA
jgi:hypothetical protein